MAEENLDLVRSIYEQTAAGDLSAVERFPYDFEFVTGPELPDAGTYRGEAAKAFIRAWVESFEGYTLQATEMIEVGGKVLVGLLQRGRPSGATAFVEGRWWQVVTVRQGEVSRIETFADRGLALRAVGLEE